MHQLFNGVAHLHKRKILHRDLKTPNILISDGVVKICDFGMARFCKAGAAPLSPAKNVMTLSYRAPELLFGEIQCRANYSRSHELRLFSSYGSVSFSGARFIFQGTKLLKQSGK